MPADMDKKAREFLELAKIKTESKLTPKQQERHVQLKTALDIGGTWTCAETGAPCTPGRQPANCTCQWNAN